MYLYFVQKNVKYETTVKKTLLVEPEIAIRENTNLLVAGWGGGTVFILITAPSLFYMILYNAMDCEQVYSKIV